MIIEERREKLKQAYFLFDREYFIREYIKLIPEIEIENILLIMYDLRKFKYDEESCSIKSYKGNNSVEILTNKIKYDMQNRSNFIIKISHKNITFQYSTKGNEKFMSNTPNLSKAKFLEYNFGLYYLLYEIGNHLENEMYEYFEIT